MFYVGDLQSGIGKALQESKLLACFVTDDGEESQLWEAVFLEESTIKPLLSTQAVVLRLKAGSQEAAYLAAIFPLPKTPTLVLIKNGDLKEYLAAGISKEDFLRRVTLAFQPPTTETSAENSPISRPTQQAPSSSSRSPVVKKENVAKEKAKAEAKITKSEEAETTDPIPAADTKYAVQQKKLQKDAREERARILKRVEDDKVARKAEATRKAQAKMSAPGNLNSDAKSESPTKPSKQYSECSIQVRLLDGSSIRSRFPSSGNLRTNVRPWIDEKQNSDAPYSFKLVLTPLPNKSLSISDEEESFSSIGLSPSATLILIRIESYTSAYESEGGLLHQGASAAYGLVTSVIGLVTGVLSSLVGHRNTNATETEEIDGTSPPATSSSTSINIRTLRDQQSNPDDQQFYNGNALNFEPRRNDEDSR